MDYCGLLLSKAIELSSFLSSYVSFSAGKVPLARLMQNSKNICTAKLLYTCILAFPSMTFGQSDCEIIDGHAPTSTMPLFISESPRTPGDVVAEIKHTPHHESDSVPKPLVSDHAC